ncbi:MAG: hypothetical protein F6K03_08250 [Kamptonema sp. SIO4C4]|nr:hypothetical protein [Kamptonema sp. SIO4C4]
MDETYQDYLNRVAKLTRSASYQSQLQNLQPSPKFREGKAVSFPGYTVNSPTWEKDEYPANQAFYQHLQTLQEQLLGEINTEMIIPKLGRGL